MAAPGSSTGPTAGQAGRDAVGSPLLRVGWGEACCPQQGGGIFGTLLGSCQCRTLPAVGASPAGAQPGGQSPSRQEEVCALPSWQAELCPSALILA